MDPSSLIFVVIVAIWAAYLLGHWVRRRDQVATVRSVDRFSEAMRVLERRPAVTAVPLSRPNPRSYVVAPAREVAPQVSVKRAPAVSRTVPAPVAAPAPVVRTPVEAPRAGRARNAVSSPAPSRPAPSASPRSRTARRARGLTLLALLAATPLAWLLVAVTQAVAWWVGAVVTLALVVTVAELRRSARQARELARRRERLERRTALQARRQTRRQVVGEVVAAHRERGAASGAGELVEPVEAAQVGQAAPEDDEAAAGGWQPVPVPPPTYTLKPKAPPRVRPAAVVPATPSEAAPVPAARAAVPAAPAPVAAPTFDLDEILERRIASGS